MTPVLADKSFNQLGQSQFSIVLRKTSLVIFVQLIKKNGPSASQATKSSKLQPLNEEEVGRRYFVYHERESKTKFVLLTGPQLADQPRYETTRIFTHKIAYSMPKELKASQQEIDQILQVRTLHTQLILIESRTHPLYHAPKTAVEFTVKSITKVPEEERDWDTVVRSFSENSLVIQRGDEHRNDSSYKPSDKNKWQGTNRAVIQEVKSWFNELISDSDVLQDKGFDFDSVAELVATAGKDAIAKLEVRDNSDDKYREASIIEYGILRYPLPSKPYFRTYSIQLFAWTQISSRLFGLKNESQSGIRGSQFVMFGVRVP
ncbi:hypothetical protein FRC02_010767 [Tulasnella sp. 418]|nr:hypothetical protein FRC02_010767 [Tulasnella sp. 418]